VNQDFADSTAGRRRGVDWHAVACTLVLAWIDYKTLRIAICFPWPWFIGGHDSTYWFFSPAIALFAVVFTASRYAGGRVKIDTDTGFRVGSHKVTREHEAYSPPAPMTPMAQVARVLVLWTIALHLFVLAARLNVVAWPSVLSTTCPESPRGDSQ
jgi:hypothetical protein